MILFFFSIGFWQCSPKYLQVHEEPFHHVVFESKKARVLDIRFPPGDTCFFHEHRNNYYYVAIKGGKCFVQDKGSEGRVLNLPDGYSGGKFNMPDDRFSHRIANLDSDTIKYIAIENLKPKKEENTKRVTYSIPGFELLESNKSFEVLKLSPFAYNLKSNFEGPLLIVNPSEKNIEVNNQKTSKNWFYSSGNIEFMFPNPPMTGHEIFLIKLK